MSGVTQSNAALIPPLAGSALVALRDACGINKANCRSCSYGYPDNDGEPGATYYCGMVCSRYKIDGTYLEDVEIDPDAEKSCWEPEFWLANIAEVEEAHPIDGTPESVNENFKAFRRFCARYLGGLTSVPVSE